MISWQSQSVPPGYSLLGERDLRDVDALDLARFETLVNARPRVAALLTLADLTEITSTCCVAADCDAASPVAVGCVAAIDMLMSGPAADGMLMSGGPETLGVS